VTVSGRVRIARIKSRITSGQLQNSIAEQFNVSVHYYFQLIILFLMSHSLLAQLINKNVLSTTNKSLNAVSGSESIEIAQ